MSDRLSPPTDNGSINYSAHPGQTVIIQGELLIRGHAELDTPRWTRCAWMGFKPHRGRNQPTKRRNLARLPSMTQINKKDLFPGSSKAPTPTPSTFSFIFTSLPVLLLPVSLPHRLPPLSPDRPFNATCSTARVLKWHVCQTIIQQCSKGCTCTTCLCVWTVGECECVFGRNVHRSCRYLCLAISFELSCVFLFVTFLFVSVCIVCVSSFCFARCVYAWVCVCRDCLCVSIEGGGGGDTYIYNIVSGDFPWGFPYPLTPAEDGCLTPLFPPSTPSAFGLRMDEVISNLKTLAT